MINNSNDDLCSNSTGLDSNGEETEEFKEIKKALKHQYLKDVIGNVGFCLVMFASFVVALPFIALAYAGCGMFLAVHALVDLVRGGE